MYKDVDTFKNFQIMEARNRNPKFNRLIFEFLPNKFHAKILSKRAIIILYITNIQPRNEKKLNGRII